MNGSQLINKFKTKGLGSVIETLNGIVLFDGRAITHRDEYPNTGLKFEAIDHTKGAMAFWFESGNNGEKIHDVGVFVDKNGRTEIFEHIHAMTDEAKRRGYTTIGEVYSDVAKYKVGPERSEFSEQLIEYQSLDTKLPVNFDEKVILDKLRSSYPGLEDLYEMAMNGNSRPLQDREAAAKLQKLKDEKVGLLGRLKKIRNKDQKTEDRNFGEK